MWARDEVVLPNWFIQRADERAPGEKLTDKGPHKGLLRPGILSVSQKTPGSQQSLVPIAYSA